MNWKKEEKTIFPYTSSTDPIRFDAIRSHSMLSDPIRSDPIWSRTLPYIFTILDFSVFNSQCSISHPFAWVWVYTIYFSSHIVWTKIRMREHFEKEIPMQYLLTTATTTTTTKNHSHFYTLLVARAYLSTGIIIRTHASTV